jgi:hypothetical protein
MWWWLEVPAWAVVLVGVVEKRWGQLAMASEEPSAKAVAVEDQAKEAVALGVVAGVVVALEPAAERRVAAEAF